MLQSVGKTILRTLVWRLRPSRDHLINNSCWKMTHLSIVFIGCSEIVKQWPTAMYSNINFSWEIQLEKYCYIKFTHLFMHLTFYSFHLRVTSFMYWLMLTDVTQLRINQIYFLSLEHTYFFCTVDPRKWFYTTFIITSSDSLLKIHADTLA